jgi:Ca2+-binding EF-hand superfamily protein
MVNMTDKQRTMLENKFGSRVDAVEAEALALFVQSDVETPDGLLDRTEFSKILGVMGANDSELGRYFFNAVDRDSDGTIDFYEFVDWMLVMTDGTVEQRLQFGFNMCDESKTGFLVKSQLDGFIYAMFKLLASLELETDLTEITRFVDELYTKFDRDMDGAIVFDEYKEGCLQNGIFIKALGNQGGPSTSINASLRLGRSMFFGHKRWHFMMCVMVGLQLVVEDTTRTAGQHPPAVSACHELEQAASKKAAVEVRYTLPKSPGSGRSEKNTNSITTLYPQSFRAIRDIFGVNDNMFLMSLGLRQVR